MKLKEKVLLAPSIRKRKEEKEQFVYNGVANQQSRVLFYFIKYYRGLLFSLAKYKYSCQNLRYLGHFASVREVD